MAAWEELEDSCYNYLKDKYTKAISIEAFGKSDSTKADIKIKTIKNGTFYVEVKADSAQCCQFVLFPNIETESFDFSNGNKAPQTDNCNAIISHMEKSYKRYAKVGKAGIPVEIDKKTLYGLVSDFYTPKGVKFFITKVENYIIFPIDKFSNYFDITAFYRRKPSGSSEPNENNNTKEIKDSLIIEQLEGSIEYRDIGNKTRCFLHTSVNVHTKRMVCPEYTYQFKDNQYSKGVSKMDKYVFEVRRLSNTSNPNVICQLSLKNKTQDKADLIKFENNINSLKEEK